MFKKVKATTVNEYISSLPIEKKDSVVFLHKFIQKSVPALKPHFASNMLGYGSFKCRNYKGEIIDWPVIALAAQKNYFSLYVCATDRGKYIAESNKSNLGKVSVGKSCIRFKKIEDIKLDELNRVLKLASKHPGLSN